MIDLEKACAQAYSIAPPRRGEVLEANLKHIGHILKNNRIYDLYQDTSKPDTYRYQVSILTPDGEIIPEEQAIFGRILNQKSTERRK